MCLHLVAVGTFTDTRFCIYFGFHDMLLVATFCTHLADHRLRLKAKKKNMDVEGKEARYKLDKGRGLQ